MTLNNTRSNEATLKLGLIGLSEGNGHPYSWSAIFNGYNKERMEVCGYPSIPRYLEQQSWPDACLNDATVTHIWTQEKQLSEFIANATYINNVVETLDEMVGEVDAVLLARDDAEQHIAMAAPFLNAGLPVYIDKPICLSLVKLEKLYSLQQYRGQIFSCTALRYAKELMLTELQREKIGTIRHIQAYTPKTWDKYAVHVIEPLLLLIGEQGELTSSQAWSNRGENYDYRNTHYSWESGLTASVSSLGKVNSMIGLRIFGDKGCEELLFSDTFQAFKNTLSIFVQSVIEKKEVINKKFMCRVVDMIERGHVSSNDVKVDSVLTSEATL